ncbi:MAG: phosphomannomutase/phosphoglucomutase [Bacteroidales bacterium]|nr:phosphomannomutase/phosphoglucomutase [Bacteroidales bacterium]
MNAFHAYDIRGIYNSDFNKRDAYKIGFYLPDLLKTNKILIGRDVRVSSPEIYEALSNGIMDAGADVYNAGLTTTPMVYFLTAKYNFEASVMITASHNGKEYNGMKVSSTNATPIGYANGLDELEQMINHEIEITKTKGSEIEFNKHDVYENFLKSYFDSKLNTLNITIDTSNGMAALFVEKLMGSNPSYLFKELDGSFPNHEANPLDPKNIVDLQKSVLANNSDIGVIFDGDADRVMFVDEKGQFISPDLMIGVLGHYFLKNNSTEVNILQDIRTSKAVEEYLLKQANIKMHTWKVGRAFAAIKLRELDGLWGGELAGHYYFKDFYYSDSGILAMLLILDVVADFKKNGTSVSTLMSSIKAYANSGEINFQIEQKKEAMEAVRMHFSDSEPPTRFLDFDGYRLEFPDWWFNIRPSNTEPYLRLIVEARSNTILNEKLTIIKNIISNYN